MLQKFRMIISFWHKQQRVGGRVCIYSMDLISDIWIYLTTRMTILFYCVFKWAIIAHTNGPTFFLPESETNQLKQAEAFILTARTGCGAAGAALIGLHFPVGSVQLRAGLSRTWRQRSTCCSPSSQPPKKLIKLDSTGPRREEHLRGEESCGGVGAGGAGGSPGP